MIWHYLKGKAASQGACLVPAPAAVVQKASISTDLSMEYFSLGEKGSITDSVPFSLRLGWNCAMEDSPSPNPLGVSRSSTVIQTRTKKPISWLFAMKGAARQCVCPGMLPSAGLPATLRQCCFLHMLTHRHLLTHRQLHVMYNTGEKNTANWKLQDTERYTRV